MLTTLRFGDRNADVVELQRLLNKKLLPCPTLVEDGKFGQYTYKAVIKFQQSVGQTTNGVVGPWTWIRLYMKHVPARFQCGRLPLPPRPSKKAPPNAPSTTTGHISPSSSNANAPWMEIVNREEGITQIKGSKHNERILEYHATTTLSAKNDETAWCSSFANWIMREAGYRGTGDARAVSWVKWGQKLETPRYGAITVVYDPKHPPGSSGYHVAFYISENSTHIKLFGGNQTREIGRDPVTKKKIIEKTVKVSSYPKNRYQVKSYCWPSIKDKRI